MILCLKQGKKMTQISDTLKNLKLLTYKNLSEIFGVTRKTIYRWIQMGRLPQPMRITARTVRFDAEQVLLYMRKWQG